MGSELGGELDGLVLDGEAADGDVVGAAVAGGGGAVAVGDLPGLTGELLECGGFRWVEDGVVLLEALAEFRGEDLLIISFRCILKDIGINSPRDLMIRCQSLAAASVREFQ